MTDHATFGVTFESDDLFVPAAEKKAQASKKLQDADDSSSNKPGHVLKSLLPAGELSHTSMRDWEQSLAFSICRTPMTSPTRPHRAPADMTSHPLSEGMADSGLRCGPHPPPKLCGVGSALVSAHSPPPPPP
jgi:hypothetical protein